MKKIILALVALAFAFAISSCCSQGGCPEPFRNEEKGECTKCRRMPEKSDPFVNPPTQTERPHRRW